MLSVKNINVYYGSIHAIKGISFHVDEGEIVTLIGANGAGKTTTLHSISGLLKVESGEIDYCGKTISRMEAHKIVDLGLAQVPEGRRIFANLSVYNNLMMGAYTRKDNAEIAKTLEEVYGRFPRLLERKNQIAERFREANRQICHGKSPCEQTQNDPLDEPSMGLSPSMSMKFSTSSSQSIKRYHGASC